MIVPNKNSLRSIISLRKTHSFTTKYKIILILHLNNTKVNDFRYLKYRVSQNKSLNFLHIKNKTFLNSLNFSQISPIWRKMENTFKILEANNEKIKKDETKNLSFHLSDLNLTILFTGNIFLLGSDSTKNLLPTLDLLEHNKNIFFLGSLIENKLYTHRDTKQLSSLEGKKDLIFSDLLRNLVYPIGVFRHYKLMIDFTFLLTFLPFLLERVLLARDLKKHLYKI